MFGAFTSFGKLGALASSVARAWSPAALWPTGTEPGMWIDPSNLATSWQDSAGTTPVSTPGTVADSSNPVGLALDLRLGAPTTLGPELVVNGDFSDGTTGWTPGILQGIPANITLTADTTIFPSGGMKISAADYPAAGQTLSGLTVGKWYEASGSIYSDSLRASILVGSSIYSTQESWHRVSRTNEVENLSCFFVATSATMTVWCAKVENNVGWQSGDFYVSNISVREVPGNHMLQATSTARPLLSAYDGQTLGPGDTYPSTGFPVYQHFDGTDDGMATASFAAGTLSNAMDCMIAVRRDSAASTILGLAAQAVDALGYFGACIPDTELSAKECGTPTVWVDGVQLSGGTAVTRGTLNTAMTVGGWHILEYRDLDLSAWTALHFARAYTGFYFNGAQGGILLFPSSTPTADRDAARTWLGAKVGLTL